MSDLDPLPFVCSAHPSERTASNLGLCGGWDRRTFAPRREFEQDGAKYPGLVKHDYWGWQGTLDPQSTRLDT